ncbi:acanthoscurrin-1 isoform X2 [Vanessa atalanta]|uniref:acanthoscurrin-1 isoform X2 n=1 Tax=Vanessa atalanta TaxID=42275 RepID=UPI001FCDCA14|nr:acanthoscurrin-1 isoform X2 [Vanessa atalanta]
MKAFLVLAAVAAIGSARPEAGYSYNAPGGGGLGGHGGIGGGSIGGGIGGGGFGGGFGGAPIVQKHIYVHVPPPEPEEQRPQVISGGAVPQKHYKIIFIKAPAPPAPITPIIPAQAQNEEKTLVYVLVKKPDEQPDITIPTAAPTQPSKPEVYFIKYKTQKEGGSIGGGAIGGGIGGGIIGGGIGGSGIGGGISGGSIGSGISGGSISGGSIGGGSIGGGHGIGSGIGSGIGGGHGSSGSVSSSYGPPGHSGGPY